MKNLFLLSSFLLTGIVHSQSLQLTSSTPGANTNAVARNTNITLVFNANIDGTTAEANNIIISSSQNGLVAGSFSGGGTSTIVFDPTTDFNPGETVQVTLTAGVTGTSGGFLSPTQQFEFRATSALLSSPFGYYQKTISTSTDGPYFVYAADINNDGSMDVLSASGIDNTIAWYENDGAQNFTSHTITTSAINARCVFAADMDSDGDLDALSASTDDDTIAWYENDGAQNFTAHNITTSANGAAFVHASDIDGDGDMDALSASFLDDTIAWYENDGAQNFTARTISISADGPRSIYTADMDIDGDLDVLSASFFDDKIAWYENDGNQNFTSHNITTSADGGFSVHAADVDNDGDMDVISASGFDDTFAWHENDGAQNFTTHTITTSADGARFVQAADMDGDGDVDVLSATVIDDTFAWYENDGTQNFTFHLITSSADYAECVYPADMDGDGDLDALGASLNNDTIAWFAFSEYDYIYDGSWAPSDPSGVSTATDNILILDGFPTLSADTEMNNLTVNQFGGILFEGVVTVNGDIVNNGQIVFLNYTSNILGQLNDMTGSNISGSGEYYVQRHIPARDDGKGAYRYLTSAVNGTDPIHQDWQEGATDISDNPSPGFGMFITGSVTGANGFDQTISGAPSMFTFDVGTQTYIPVPNTDVDNLIAGKGYVAYVWGDRSVDITTNNDPVATTTTLPAIGSIKIGTQPVSGLSTTAGDFNLIGNPYQAIVNVNDFLADATNLDSSTYYVWDPNLGTRGAYATVTLPAGTPTPSTSDANQYLQPGQAAFFATVANGATSASFEEFHKDVFQTPTDVFRPQNVASIELQLFQQQLFDNGGPLSDALRVNFSQGESNTLQPNDALKLSNRDENVALVNGNKHLAIEYRSLPVDGETLQLFNDQYRVSGYVFKVIVSNMPDNISTYLIDAHLGTQTPLNQDTSTLINFSVDEMVPASIGTDRFSIVFAENSLSTVGFAAQGFTLYPNPTKNGEFFILTSGIPGQEIKVKIYNLLGQQVFKANKEVNANNRIPVKTQSLETGLYLVKINHNGKTFTEKLIIQ